MKMLNRIVVVSILIIIGFAGAPAAQAQQTLNGAGATFPAPIYARWFADYHKLNPSVSFDYQAIGSARGQKSILEGSVDFGASDGPMDNKSLAKAASDILHIPTVAGAVAVTYNLPGIEELKLDGPTIAEIYLGRITRWNDPAIVMLNSGVALPDTDITVVHRSDGSGTSYIFTDYLRNVSPFWDLKVGRFASPNWPVGLGAKGNDGIMEVTRQAAGSIGYVELTFALHNKVAVAEIKNAAGEYMRPTVDGVTAAMSAALIPDDFRFSMVNAPGRGCYPIAGATWLLVYRQQADRAKGKALVAFLKWAITDGEKEARALDYAPLADSVQKRVLERIDTMTF